MTEQEQLEWVRMLGRTKAQQAAVIFDLLRHANQDRMSAEDRAICRKHLARLNREMGVDPQRLGA